MGMGGISVWQLLIILLIVVLLFGTKKLRNMGGDLGSALRNFKKAVKEGEEPEAAADDKAKLEEKAGTVYEGQATQEKDKV